jgi:hypothetical protein
VPDVIKTPDNHLIFSHHSHHWFGLYGLLPETVILMIWNDLMITFPPCVKSAGCDKNAG